MRDIKKFPSSSLCMQMTMKTLEALRLTKSYVYFNLRQGTIMVAIGELALTSIMLFLLLIAAMNSQEIASVATAELQAMESNWVQEFEEKLPIPFNYLNNERRMIIGQHLATLMMTLTYAGVVLSFIHILSCMMLLYGAINDIANFLLPWLSTVLLSIIISCILLVSFIFFHHQKCIVFFYIPAIVFLAAEFYAWQVVFSYYMQISFKIIYKDIENIMQPYQLGDDFKHRRVDI